jgi:hypothetical protein
MLLRVALVRIDISEECGSSIMRVTRIGELGTTLAVISNRSALGIPLQLLVTANVVHSSLTLVILMMDAICSSEISVLTRATRRNICKDGNIHRMNMVLHIHDYHWRTWTIVSN